MTASITTFCIKSHYAECHDLFIAMLNDFMLSVIMLNIVMLNVVMLNVVMLNVFMLNVVMLNVVASKRLHRKTVLKVLLAYG